MTGFKALFAPRDLTEGSTFKGLLLFAVPLLVGNFVQQLYNTVDAFVVSQYVGDLALGAVGVCGPIINLLIVLMAGVATGAGILVSQYFGARDKQRLSVTVGTTLTLAVIAGLLMTLIGTLLARPLLELLSTPPEIIGMAVEYLETIFLGVIGCVMYNIFSGILRGMGDSITPLLSLILAAVLNVVLDVWFVAGLGMDTMGVALATVLSQAISALLCLWRLLHMKNVVTLNRSMLRLDGRLAKKILALGMPAGVTQAIFSLSSIIVQALANSMGANVVTATTTVMRVDGFAMMPNFTFGIAATTFAAQNIGARKLDRLREGTRQTMLMGVGTSTVITLCILLFGEALMRVFTQTPVIVALGARQFRIMAAGYIAFAVTQVLTGVMRGAGDTVRPMWISILCTVVIRLPMAYLWAALSKSAEWPNGSPDSLYFSLLISWILGMLLSVFLYKRGGWRKGMRKVIEAPADGEGAADAPNAQANKEVLPNE